VIAAVPALIPATNPILSTVATAVFDDIHGFIAATVADPFKDIVDPAHTVNVPVIVGNVFTVTLAVCEHPLLFV
jgi:hypothetical protein